MTNHAKLSASGSSRWMNCPGSVSLEHGIPNPSTDFAAEGTAAHQLATWCLTNQAPALNFIGKNIRIEEFTFEVDYEMVEAVQQYVDFCNGIPGDYEWIEQRVEYTDWVPDGFGTSDHIKVATKRGQDFRVIHVTDFKYGKGVRVYAENNSQAMIYALGVYQTYNYLFAFKPEDLVVCTIVQPRLDHIDEFKITIEELLEWADRELFPAAKAAMSDNPTLTPGEKQCRFCRAKPTCPALAEQSLKTVFEDFKVIEENPGFTKDFKKLTNEQIGIVMKLIPVMQHWGKSVEAYAFDELNAGRAIPGYKLVEGKKQNKAFLEKDDEVLVTSLVDCGLTKKEVITEKIKTPTQLAKVLKTKKKDPVKFDELWDQKDGNPTIAESSDKRPEIAQEFSKITI